MSQFFLIGQQYALRNLEYSDIGPRYLGWMRDPEVIQYLAPSIKSHTLETLQEYWERNQKKNIKFLAIVDKESGQHIGNVRFEIYEDSSVELGMIVGEKSYWGKSCMYDVYGLLIRYAFEEKKLNKVTLGAEQNHLASIITFKKLGFKFEKIVENAYIKNGQSINCLRFVLSLDDYLRNKNFSIKS